MNPETETSFEEPARDILAAEAFGVPARDPALGHGPVDLPEDPTGIEEPHDVLAAEEFAMPAWRPSPRDARAARVKTWRRLILGAIAGLGFALVVRRAVTLL